MRKVRHQGVSRRGQSLDHVAPESVPLTAALATASHESGQMLRPPSPGGTFKPK